MNKLMIFSCAILILIIIPTNQGKLLQEVPDHNLGTCISGIVKKITHKTSDLTYVDIKSNNKEIIEILNTDILVPIISKSITETTRQMPLDQSYLIAAGKTKDFLHIFSKYVEDESWNPSAPFIIIINGLLNKDLQQIFDVLLNLHVINVLVMNESSNLNIYSFNPFDNYGCGHYYNKIIDHGKCCNINETDIFSYKLTTGLKECTLRVSCRHWPPFTMDPTTNSLQIPGIEEFIINEISNIEEFPLKFTYSHEGELFSTSTKNKTNVGVLYTLQTEEADLVISGMLLTHPRALIFNYISGYYIDDIRYLVKKATAVDPWQNIYLEFNVTVWIILSLTFIIYFLIFITLVRAKDKTMVWLRMLAYLVINSSKIQGNYFLRYFFILWVWFAYIINAYYQSGLVSLMNNPATNYQISSEEDIINFNLKPCVSKAMRTYLESVQGYVLEETQEEVCDPWDKGVRHVSQSEDVFTLVAHILYKFNRYNFYDRSGKCLLHTLSQPFSKLIYAIYAQKGFPMTDRFNIHILRLRENGLIQHYIRTLYWRNIEKYRFIEIEKVPYFVVPWCVLLFGYLLTLGIFVLEVLADKCKGRKEIV